MTIGTDIQAASVKRCAIYSLGRRPASFARLVRLNYLAPDIVAAIIDGEQPADLTRQKLAQIDLPIDWPLQRRLLGFSEVLKYG